MPVLDGVLECWSNNNHWDGNFYNDADDIGKDKDIQIFIIGRRFRYSLLYSVLGFFFTTLLEPYSE